MLIQKRHIRKRLPDYWEYNYWVSRLRKDRRKRGDGIKSLVIKGKIKGN